MIVYITLYVTNILLEKVEGKFDFMQKGLCGGLLLMGCLRDGHYYF